MAYLWTCCLRPGLIPAPHAQALNAQALILRLGRMRFRPKSVKALRNCFASHFGLRPCGQTRVDASIQLLVEQRHIMINGGKVEYMSLSPVIEHAGCLGRPRKANIHAMQPSKTNRPPANRRGHQI